MFSVELSGEWSKTRSKKYRYDRGQFFTPVSLRQQCWDHLPVDFRPTRCLEPSCGSGEFLYDLVSKYPDVSIDGYDIDSELIDSIRPLFPTCNLQCSDFLNTPVPETYDLIVGNPPYSELAKSVIYDDGSSSYKEIIEGRSNLFALFLYKCIRLLSQGGYLYFVIPSTLLVSQSFHQLRRWICNQGKILSLNTVDSEKTEFVEAQQGVVLFLFQKTSIPTKDYLFELRIPPSESGYLLFTENKSYFETHWDPKKTMKYQGLSVKTGSLTWNTVRDELSNENGIRIIYSHTIGEDNTPRELDHPQKLKYWNPSTTNKRIEKGPVLFINRITGASPVHIRSLLWTSEEPCIGENHVQVVYGSLRQLQTIQKSLKDPRTLEWIQQITFTTQCSKRDLEERIVFF